MGMQILHVVDSLACSAGAVGHSLAGLFRALEGVSVAQTILVRDGSRLDGISATQHDAGAPESVELVGDADVIHLHGWCPNQSLAVARAAQKAGKPYIISSGGMLCENPIEKSGWRYRLRASWSEKPAVRRAAAVLASNTAEQEALSRAGLGANARILPYGLDFETTLAANENAGSTETEPSSDERVLLLLGPIHPAEGVVAIMKAFAEIGADADGWLIVLAGSDDGPWRQQLEAAVRRKGGSDRVQFVCDPDEATQSSWLQRASVLASPALHFRVPVSIMQALAGEIVALASPRTVPDGMNGAIHVCGAGRDGMRSSLRTILGYSDDERAARAKQARVEAKKKLDWSVLVADYVQLYESLS